MRIGIYGGSFNPIHNGHLAIARELIDSGFVDEIWFVVSPHNPLKEQKDLWPDSLRLQLVEQALKPYPQLKASDVEFHLPKPSYMWATLNEISSQRPDDNIVLLVGADNWLCFPRWYRYQDILDRYEIGIYPRPGYEIDTTALPPRVTFLPTNLYDISSTQIRQQLAAGNPISHLVPPTFPPNLEPTAACRREKQTS